MKTELKFRLKKKSENDEKALLEKEQLEKIQFANNHIDNSAENLAEIVSTPTNIYKNDHHYDSNEEVMDNNHHTYIQNKIEATKMPGKVQAKKKFEVLLSL